MLTDREAKSKWHNHFFTALAASAEARESLRKLDEAYRSQEYWCRSLAAQVVQNPANLDLDPAHLEGHSQLFYELLKDGRRRSRLQRLYRNALRAAIRPDRRAFRRVLVEKWWPLLSTPPQVTMRELEEQAVEEAEIDHCDTTKGDGSVDYGAAVLEIASLLSTRCRRPLTSAPRPVAVIQGGAQVELGEVWSNEYASLFYSAAERKQRSRLGLTPDDEAHFTRKSPPRTILFVTLEGYFTPAALREQAELLASQLAAALSLVASGSRGYVLRRARVPVIEGAELARETRFVERLFAELYAPQAPRATLGRQIQGCVRLLTLAERQTDVVAYVALASAALEALLSTPNTAVTQWIAEAVATLVEPEPSVRGAAVAFMKKLYDIRSRIVHGDSTDTKSEYREHFRMVIHSCLKTVLGYSRAVGSSHSTQEFHKEIFDSKMVAARFGFELGELPARRLWTGPEKAEP